MITSGRDGAPGRLRALLPAGDPLPAAMWRTRHRAVGAFTAVLLGCAVLGYLPLAPDGAAAAVVAVLTVTALLVVAALPWRLLAPERSRALRASAAALALTAAAALVAVVAPGSTPAQVVLVIAAPLVAVYCAWPPLLVALAATVVERVGVAVAEDHPAAWSAPFDVSTWPSTGQHLQLVVALVVLSLALWRSAEGSRADTARLVAHLEHVAHHDELTGLPNRAGFTEALVAALGDPGTAGRVTVVVVDLLRFREVNDTLGHTAGDELLRTAAAAVAPVIAASAPDGVLARLGGDDFALLLPGHDSAAALRVAGAVRRRLGEGVEVAGLALDVDLAAGVAEHRGALGLDAADPADPADLRRTAEELLRHANVARHAAKEARTGARVYDAAQDHHSTARLETARDLRLAVARDDQLLLHFQPKVALGGDDDGRLVGVEALVRWRHPTRGPVSPADFISVVEATDLVHPFTAKVLHLALVQARRWLDAGHRVPVAVNVPPRCLVHPGFAHGVVEALVVHGVPPSLLRLEITEDALVADPDAAALVITELRAVGVPTSIDDFGTGYSSLSYLRRLPVDEVKLDRSFVTGLGRPAGADDGGSVAADADGVLVASIIDLAHRLGMTVVAEGVEEGHEADALRQLGADVAQGYLFGRPVPAAEVPADLLAGAASPAGGARGHLKRPIGAPMEIT